MNNRLAFHLVLLGILMIQGIYTHHIYGTDTSLTENPIQGPGEKTTYVEFSSSFPAGVIPHVLISFSKFHFTMAQLNQYRASVTNVTHKGFSILYETETAGMVYGGDIEWLAFDETSDYFGEVLYVEEYDTGDLQQFFKTGDEHRMQLKPVNFKRTYQNTPGVAIYVVGAKNQGIERLVSANYTDATPFSFTLQALAWHHTELYYYKFAILTYYKDECYQRTGRQYVWAEESHSFKPHPWNQIHLYQDKDFRHMHYDIPIEHETVQNFRPDYIYTGFVGYDIKNYKANSAEFNLALKNVELSKNKKGVSMDVGTWNKTQVAGAQWNYLVCETNGEFVKQGSQSFLQRLFSSAGSYFLVIVAIFVIYKVVSILGLIKRKKVKEL